MIIPMSVIVAAKQVGVSAALLFSVCHVESHMKTINNFQDGHGRGSFGVCMVSLEVARSFKPEADRLALQQLSYNLLISAMYLKSLSDNYNGNISYIAAAYNGGYVYFNGKEIRNQVYVNKVLKVYGEIKGEE